MSFDLNKEKIPAYLLAREWFACFFMIVILATLTTISLIKERQEIRNHFILPKRQIKVRLIGPGTDEKSIYLTEGANYQDLVPYLNQEQFDSLEKRSKHNSFKDGEIIIVPKSEMISVFVTGEVEVERVFSFPKNMATFRDLISQIVPKENADMKKMRRLRRKLKDGEIVVIPSKGFS